MKALGLLRFLQALCLNGRASSPLPVETSCVPVVRSIALLAIFPIPLLAVGVLALSAASVMGSMAVIQLRKEVASLRAEVKATQNILREQPQSHSQPSTRSSAKQSNGVSVVQ